MEAILQDFRYGARRLLRSPGFSALVIITLALGIGANTAIFSVVNTLLLRPLPYSEPSELVTIEHVYPSLDDMHAPVSARGFGTYRDETSSFAAVAVRTGWGVNMTGLGEPERLVGARASADYFRVYGALPALGRTFLPEEDQPGAAKVVVISDGLWKRAFGSDPGILQRTIALNDQPHQIVGVMPADFVDFSVRTTEVWVPVALTTAQLTGGFTNEFLALTARLKPGVSIESAQAEMTQLGTRLKAVYTDQFPQDWHLEVTSLTEKATGNIRTPLLILLGSVCFVLLIACANVANLLLARAAGRLKEVSVRLALGAKRWQIIRQLLSESLLLGLIGGIIGLGIAYGGVKLLAAFAPPQLSLLDTISIDAKVMLFTLLISLGTGFVFGLAPALQSTRANVNGALRDGGRGAVGDRSGQSLRRVFVIAEFALALTLLAGAGLLIRSYERLAAVDPGFDTENMLTFNVALPASRYDNDTVRAQFFDRALSAIKGVPGVRGVAAASVLPFSGGWSTGSFSVERFTPAANQQAPWGDIRIVNEDYAEAMGMELVRGRFLEAADRMGGRDVVVIDEVMAERYWPGVDPVGKRITFDAPSDSADWISVIGVVAHTSQEALDAEARVQLYFSYRQAAQGFMTVGVRTTGDPNHLAPAVRQAVKSVDAGLPLANVSTMEQLVADSIGSRRLSTTLLGLFSGLALLLAAIGIYGVIADSVTQRTRELGVRMALGAGKPDMLRLVMMQGVFIACVGLVVGLGGAFGLTRLMKSQLFQVDAADPATFAAVAGILVAVALLATLLPALRAMRLDPVQALRQD